MANPFDSVNDGPKQDDGLVEVGRKKSKPRVAPRYIPSKNVITEEEGITTIRPTAPAVARSVEHLKTLKSPMISQGAGRKMKTGEVKCDYSDSPDVHSGPATHFLRLPGVSREGVEAVCEKHLRMAQEKAVKTGDELNVRPISQRSAEGFKVLRRIQEQEKLAGVQIGLIQKGMSGESAQYGPAKYKTTAAPTPFPPASGHTPVDPNWDPNAPTPRGKKVNYEFPKKTTKVAIGKHEPEAYVSPELSDEELSKLDPGTRAMVQGRRARGVPAWGLKQYSSKNIGTMPMAFTPKPEAVTSAFEKLAAEQEPTVRGEVSMEKQAVKQRTSELARRDKEFRQQLERHALQNKPKELE